MLRQRLDTEQLLIPPSPFPVDRDLVPPQGCPFSDELQSAGIKVAGEPLRSPKLRPAARRGKREVGHRVIALVPVHIDDDP
jgi:hypothetical protein